MKNKKKNKSKSNFSNEDYSAIRGRGNKKNKKRSRRHTEKRFLDGLSRGNIDPYLYQDYIENE
jgi:hypothetical protein